MKRSSRLGVVPGFAVAAVCLGASLASAQEGVAASAFSSLGAEGAIYETGPDEAIFVGVLSGVLYVEDATGAVEAGLIVCPGRIRVNTADSSQSAQADCAIVTAEGDRIYADFSCEGAYREGCYGELALVGGLGGREGVTGGGPAEFLTAAPDWAATPGNAVSTEAAGLLRIPELTFRLP